MLPTPACALRFRAVAAKHLLSDLAWNARYPLARTTMTRASAATSDPVFTIEKEAVEFQRYITFYNRSIRFPPTADHPEGPVYEYDVIGHPKANFHFCVTFPFHPAASGRWRDGEVSLIREFCQGTNGMVYVLPTGGFDPKKHADYEQCAMAELSEEAHLKGGQLTRLLAPGVGVPEVKWCCNRFTPFIVMAPEHDEQPGSRDVEEYIEMMRVSIPQLKEIMRSGEMLLPSVSTCWWAFEFLEEQQERKV